ncbi:aminoacylase-1-like [Plutella xylostella]|uniref:aminoacylase-1-like n=1 Tax=Plutella xylostella TaxID=51655 RepID=UPI002032527C|nr:aminoacylase-1-like [Plutella xylostella]
MEVLQQKVQVPNTRIDDSNPFWVAIRDTAEKEGYTLTPVICPGATDAQYLRRAGVPALGLSPLPRTPLLLHSHDERLHVDSLVRGVEVFEKMVKALGDV